jgi:hypothetical protein
LVFHSDEAKNLLLDQHGSVWRKPFASAPPFVNLLKSEGRAGLDRPITRAIFT